MVKVPAEFQPRMPFAYPSDNHTEFEWWFKDTYKQQEGRIYLPVMWTAYYVRHGINKNSVELKNTWWEKLQWWLYTGVNPNMSYYTIVQHDDGILHDLKHLDIKVFSTGGGSYDHAIPLISCPHEWQFRGADKTILASFVGQLTHPIRNRIIDKYGLRNDSIMLSVKKMPLKEYCHILAMSKYVLCPRGYGPTSFRIQEAIQYGAVPVYISDVFIEPMGIPFETYGIKIKESEIDSFDLTRLHPSPWDEQPLPRYSDIFTYGASKRYILDNVNL